MDRHSEPVFHGGAATAAMLGFGALMALLGLGYFFGIAWIRKMTRGSDSELGHGFNMVLSLLFGLVGLYSIGMGLSRLF